MFYSYMKYFFFQTCFHYTSETLASKVVEVVLEAIKLVGPRIVVNGHIHYGGHKPQQLPW